MATVDQLKELTKKRGSFKGQLTNFINFCMELKQPLSPSVAKELQLRVSKIELLYDRFDEVQLQIECLVDEASSQYAARAEYDSQYYKALASAQEMLNTYNELPMCNTKSIVSNRKLVKLPTIQLPKFNGSYENWLEFRDTFASLVHSNDDIDDINKYHYLRACLESSAAVVIQSTEFSASTYNVAWNMLCERYDNKRLLVQNHMNTLFNIETVTKESSINLKRLIDHLKKNLRALEVLGEPVAHWDTLLIYIITKKLDHKTYREWEEYKGRLDEESSNKFSEFMKFLSGRADLLETLELSHTNPTKSNSKFKSMVTVQHNSKSSLSNADSPSKPCPKCRGNHLLASCSQFLALSNEARLKLLPAFKICFNCFKSGHYANHCKKPGCNICKRRHSSLIHVSNLTPASNNTTQSETVNPPVSVASSSSPSVSTSHSGHTLSANVTSSEQLDVLLSTALVKLYDNNNREHVVRAVLDSGSTSCMMTESLCSRLHLSPHQIDRSILGINNITSHVGKTCRVNMKSLDEKCAFDFYCFVLPSITNDVPSREIDITNLQIPSNICLADPTFYKPAAVDILLGADLFWDLLGSHRIDLGNKKPMLCETKLGWIISGPISNSHISLMSRDIRCHFIKMSDEHSRSETESDFDLTRFWQLEDIPTLPSSHYSQEEKQCEEHFIKHMSRLEDGRFCVRIPLKQNPEILGNSLNRATQCLLSMERRLKANPDLSEMYHEVMSEYESLGHMSACQPNSSQISYYIPHHGIRRDQSTTTKLRVVYNASSPTTSGVSFNDIQMVGPTVQDDLLAILLRFRQHKYILAADVEKMYRQIVVHPYDRFLQQILWRSDTKEQIKVFQLNTVTYGTTSAPFLATRCLKQLGLECNNPKVAKIIEHDFYVDDLLTGGDDLSEVMDIRKEITAELASAGMPLRKWQSNEPQLVSDYLKTPFDLNIGSHEASKLLGLGWCADSDELCFPMGLLLPKGNTKRDILSAIAQIFDPLGLLSPGVVRMKMLLQQLWLQKISWDEPLSPEIHKRWNDIVKTLPLINNIRIPRIVVCDSYSVFQLHIFTDASELAYGACAYVRTVNDSGEVLVRLLSGKSRVAPIKPLSVPRLELCGALVGTRLYEKILNSLRVAINEVCIWTDSTIVLGWLQMHPSKLQPFVRNRVAEVLDKAGNCTWRHIPTELNPADLLSRGTDISSLQTSKLWWSGPDFLNQEPIRLPTQPTKCIITLPETKPDVSLAAVTNSGEPLSFIDMSRFSNYLRIVRTVAYILRWIDRCRKRSVSSSFLSDSELKNALNLLIRQCQIDSFPEYQALLNKQALAKKSPLLKFNVYLDEHSIMRVGGRLDNSEYQHSKKHPILLQSTHALTKLIFEFEHRRLMHAGPQSLLASIRETYWPIGGRSLARACYRKCVRCSRMTGKTVVPLMGNLPRQRISSRGFPFENVGVDYAGPIMCASRQGRGCRLVKVYIAVFVCFSTKAIHLELVGGLTSNIFLMALYRFMSRRGKPSNLYSDNGTSFVGACNDIAHFLKQNCNSLGERTANDGITFHFIPAYSPHMGGLWEAGVKSTKYHLHRVLGNCNLSYEELNTTLTQIEAILNSRPLTPLSSDPADNTPLTPGHFIIGRPLTCLPQPDYTDRCSSQLTRFHRIEQLRQHFWARWSKEYIAELQLRVKWRSCQGSLKLDTLVVVKEEHMPPLKWKLGRILALHPGSDGVARVADIKTSTGVIRRSFSKICPLPVHSESG